MLDASAGNRIIWKGRNPRLPYVVFMDRELNLRVPPDVFADSKWCPFRDKVFDVVIYDPPFMARSKPSVFWNDPTETPKVTKRGFKTTNIWYGIYKTVGELWKNIHESQKEFQRITNRLCLKWVEVDYSLWKALAFFKKWTEIRRQGFKKKRIGGRFGVLRASDDSDSKAWWITFKSSEFNEKGEENGKT